MAEGVIKRVVDGRGRDSKPRGLVAVDVHENGESVRRDVAGNVGELRKLPQPIDQLWCPLGELRWIRILKNELILCPG